MKREKRKTKAESPASNPKSEIINRKSLLARRLLAWFSKHARELPWRGTRDPYRIWVSEVMLQQTQVATVVDYYKRFLARFENVAALAAASEEDVLRLWEGLGYYRRARQMHLAARRVVSEHGGNFPREASAVRALPGIGRYTAGAILSIAHDDSLPILEANTIRLFSRLAAYRGDPTSSAGQKFLWQLAEELLPGHKTGLFNQALMELGAEVCTPRNPRCEECPLAALCPTRAWGLQAEIPAPAKKTRYEAVREAAVVVWRNGKVLLRRCAPGERWAGLWDFPRFAVVHAQDAPLTRELEEQVCNLTGVTISAGNHLTTLKHGVTKFRITLLCHAAEYVSSSKRHPASQQRWLAPTALADLPLSTTGRKIAQFLVQQED